MKFLRNYLDKIKPNFQKGGKFAKLQSVFGGFETFLFVPNHVTHKGSHFRDAIDLKRTMSVVVIALIPALLFGMWNVGHNHFLSLGQDSSLMENFWYGLIKVLPIVIVAYVAGLGVEFAAAQIRGHEINEGFLVSGMLIPLIVPPDTPLWMVAVAVIFSVIFGKEVFGGTGMNIVNPALLTRAFLFFAYPQSMSGDFVWIAEKADAFSGATPMAELAANKMVSMSPIEMMIGAYPGSVGETSVIAIGIGAIILLFTGIASWKTMFSFFAGGLAMGLLLNAISGSFPDNNYLDFPAYQHLLIGGFAFGGVFMITDPVTAAQTERGKYIYGFLAGVIAIMVRVLNPAYPEGVMLAILLMNVMAPLIDYFVVESHIKSRLKKAKTLQIKK